MICFSSYLWMSSFIFCRTALQISEYSMLSVGIPFLLICLRFSLSYLVPVDSLSGFSLFVSACYWNGSFMNHLRSCITSRFKIVWWNRCERCRSILDFDLEFSPMMLQLTCIYLFRLGNHFCSLKLGVNPLLSLLSCDDHYRCWDCWWPKHQVRC